MFLSRYIYERLHDQSIWNANISAFVNRIADALLELKGKPVDDAYRPELLTILCRQILRRTDSHKMSRFRVTWRVTPHFIGLLFPRSGDVVTQQPFDLHLMTARLLLSRKWNTGVDKDAISHVLDSLSTRALGVLHLGTSLDAAITGGDVELVRDILKNLPGSFDVNDPERWYLRSAVCSGHMDMVKLVLNPPDRKRHRPSGPLFEISIVEAIRRRRLDMAWSLLSIDSAHPRRYYLHEGIRAACYTGDVDIVAHILRTGPSPDVQWTFDCCITPLEIACRAGHEDIVKLLLKSGANPLGLANLDRIGKRRDYGSNAYPADKPLPPKYWSIHDNRISNHLVVSSGAMFGAAVYGHIDVANLLISAGIELTQADWQLIAKGVVERNQTNFLRWMLDEELLHLDEVQGETFDLLGEACVWGNIDTMKLLVSHQILSDRPTWALDIGSRLQLAYGPYDRYGVVFYRRFESPMLAAMSWSRTDIVGFLLDQKLPPIEDISSTSVGHLWKTGQFPRKPVRTINDSHRWGWSA